VNTSNISLMSDLDLWSAVVGAVLPLLIAVVVRSHWTSQLKGAVTVASCLLVGGVTALVSGYLDGISIMRSVLVVLFSTVLTYATLWYPSGIAPAIEEATTPGR
jgi:VIT1/CCC1 family predicted Fe2+/Mn2+ transporter